MGRRKGSKNKVKSEKSEIKKVKKVKKSLKNSDSSDSSDSPKKKGRPVGSKNNVKDPEIIPEKKIRAYKLLGYCSKCKTMITKKDLESPRIFNCPGCKKRANTGKLKAEYNITKAKSKREYLNTTIHVNYDVTASAKTIIPQELINNDGDDS